MKTLRAVGNQSMKEKNRRMDEVEVGFIEKGVKK